jgi:hypothetical protein
MYWISNRTALLQGKPRHQTLIEALEQTEAATEIQLCPTAAEDYTLRYGGIYLHSMRGAQQEAADTLLDGCQSALGRAHLIIGLGLGYLLEAVYQHSPGNLVVYEPDLALLKFLLENVDFTEYLGSGRVWIATRVGELLEILRPMTTGEDPMDILVIPGYAQLFSAEIPQLMARLMEMMEERMRDWRTGQHFHSQWTRQFFQNLPYFTQTVPFETVASPFQGKPALIIGRGPSLDNALDDIRALADSVTLISVGSGLQRLYQEGITPDMAVFYDANGLKEQFHGLPDDYLREIIFFMSPFTESLCFEKPSQDKVLFYPQSGEAFAHWLKGALPEQALFSQPLILEGGGTVSLLAMQLAFALQSSHILLIGQDLAFPNNQVYAGGMPIQQDDQGRLTLEKSETLYTAPEAMTTVTGQNQEMLPALKAYAGFIRHFERLAEANAKNENATPLFNASLGGAAIQGYAIKALSEFRGCFDAFKPQSKAQTPLKENLPRENKDGPTCALVESIRVALSRLHSDIAQSIQLHETSLQHGPQASATNQALFEFLNRNPLISHFLLFEMMAAQRRYIAAPCTPQEVTSNKNLLVESTRNCIELLGNQILPQVISTERRMLKGWQGILPDQATSSPSQPAPAGQRQP